MGSCSGLKSAALPLLAVISAMAVTFVARDAFCGGPSGHRGHPAPKTAVLLPPPTMFPPTTLAPVPSSAGPSVNTTTTTVVLVPAGKARSSTPAATRTGPSAPASSVPTTALSEPSELKAQQVASLFTEAMLSWAPGDSTTSVRGACSQWASAAVLRSLPVSSAHGPDGATRAPGETDTVVAEAISAEDSTGSGVGESVVAMLSVKVPGSSASNRTVYLEEWVARGQRGWRISQVVPG
jgi:hypothetical protein